MIKLYIYTYIWNANAFINKRNEKFKGICIFRFDSPLLFTNVERFKVS